MDISTLCKLDVENNTSMSYQTIYDEIKEALYHCMVSAMDTLDLEENGDEYQDVNPDEAIRAYRCYFRQESEIVRELFHKFLSLSLFALDKECNDVHKHIFVICPIETTIPIVSVTEEADGTIWWDYKDGTYYPDDAISIDGIDKCIDYFYKLVTEA